MESHHVPASNYWDFHLVFISHIRWAAESKCNCESIQSLNHNRNIADLFSLRRDATQCYLIFLFIIDSLLFFSRSLFSIPGHKRSMMMMMRGTTTIRRLIEWLSVIMMRMNRSDVEKKKNALHWAEPKPLDLFLMTSLCSRRSLVNSISLFTSLYTPFPSPRFEAWLGIYKKKLV